MIASVAKQLFASGRRRPVSVTAIDFDGHVVRIAEVSHRGRRPKITRLAAADLPADLDHTDPVACGQWLGQALRELKIKPKYGVVMGVPRGQVMLKPLTLPMPDDPLELAGMVHFQVGKELPFPPEEAVVDFTIHRHVPQPVPDDAGTAESERKKGDDAEAPSATVEVLAAITRRSVVEDYRRKAEAADLDLVGLGLRSYANVRTIEASGVESRQQAVALISLRPDEVIIDILVESRLAFSRMAAANLHGHHEDHAAQPAPATEAEKAGSQDGDKAASPPTGKSAEEGVVDLLSPDPVPPPKPADRKPLVAGVIKEVVRSLHGYRMHPDHKEVGQVVVAGETGHEQAVASALGDRLGTPCQVIDPAADLGYRGKGKEGASAAIAAIGLGIGATDRTGLPFDFLNPTRPAVKKDRRPLMAAAAVALVLFLGLGMTYQRISQTGERQQVLDGLQEQVEDLRDNRDRFRQMERNHNEVQAWLDSRRHWLDHYLYLSAVLPSSENVYVSNFATTSGGNLRLNLHARSGEVLIELDRRLRDAGYVIRPMSVQPGNDPHDYNFRTTVELSIPSDFDLGDEKLEELAVPERPEDDIFRMGVSDRGGDGGTAGRRLSVAQAVAAFTQAQGAGGRP